MTANEETRSIEIRDVGKEFVLPDGSKLQAIEDASFSVGESEFVSILGPSGCGKSTLLRLVADILQPSSGNIFVHGHMPSEARKRRLFGFMAQDPVMLPWRNVIQNVRLPLEMAPDTERAEARPHELLKLVGLSGFESASPGQLSGGMRQRAALARALLLNPRVLLMDEPFGALDEITREQMNLELARIWKATSAAVIFITHSVDEAIFLSDRVVVMSPRPGRVRDIVEINLSRPRGSEIKETPEFFEYQTRIRSVLRQSSDSN